MSTSKGFYSIIFFILGLFIAKPSQSQTCKADFGSDFSSIQCVPFAVQFFDSSSSDVIFWFWNFGDNDTIYGTDVKDPFIVYSKPGKYDVTLIIENSSGCRDTVTKQNYINAGGAIIIDTTMIDTSVCIPYKVHFGVETIGHNSIMLDFGNGFIQFIESGESVTHEYLTGANFTPIVAISDSSGKCSIVLKFPTINVPDPTVSFFTNKTYSEIGEIDFTNTTNGKGADSLYYEWDFGDSTPIDTSKNPIHYYSYEGIFNVKLRGILKDKDGVCYFDTTCYDCITIIDTSTSINKRKNNMSDIIIYPNPNKGIFYISHKSKNYSINTIKIFNIDGELIYFDSFKGDINNANKQINIIDHKKGIYNIQLITNSYLINKRVVIE